MRTRPNARAAFWALAFLALLAIAGLGALLALLAPALVQGVWLRCRDALAALQGAWPALGLALPLLLWVMMLARGLWSLALQLRQTSRLVARLDRRRRPLPPALASLARDLGLEGRLILVNDEAAFAFTQGLLRPRIWLSAALVALLDREELQAVLRHERHHLRQRDPLRVLVSRSLAAALFFVPAAPALRDAYIVAKEVDADEASGADAPLAAALVKLLRTGAHLPQEASLAAIGPLDTTGARIDRLLQRKRSGRSPWAVPSRTLLLSLAVAAALLTLSYASLVRAASPLEGGKCGYSTMLPDPGYIHQWQVTPADYSPANALVD